MNNFPIKNIFPFLLLLFILTTTFGCRQKTVDNYILSDNWSYALGKDGDTIESAQQYSYSSLPDPFSLPDLVPDKTGVIWLKQEFILPPSLCTKELSLLADRIAPNDEIYINGHLIGKTGLTPDRDKHFFSEWNSVRNYSLHNFFSEKSNQILIRIYVFGEGSVVGHLMVGPENQINSTYRTKEYFLSWINYAISFLLFFVAGYYLFIYLNIKTEKEYLYYAIVVFSTAVFQSNFFVTKLPLNFPSFLNYFLFRKYILLSIHIQGFFFIKFFHAFTKVKRKKTELFFFLLYFVPLTVLLLIPDYPTYISFPQLEIALTGLTTVIYILVNSIILLKRKNKDIIWFFSGSLPVLVLILFDLIFHNILGFSRFIHLGFLGTPIFMLIMSFLLGLRYVRAQKESELLNKSLEKLVKNRTDQLNQATKQLQLKNRKLEEIANIDPLSDLYNRRYFLSRLETEFERDHRYSQSFSLMMLDIDHFKAVNDTYGHLVGDEVISGISEILKKNIRTTDLASRYGGEEFCILLPSTETTEAFKVAEKLREVINQKRFLATDREFHITASIGVAGLIDSDKDTSAVISRADEALYRAKRSGRNQTCMEEIQ